MKDGKSCKPFGEMGIISVLNFVLHVTVRQVQSNMMTSVLLEAAILLIVAINSTKVQNTCSSGNTIYDLFVILFEY